MARKNEKKKSSEEDEETDSLMTGVRSQNEHTTAATENALVPANERWKHYIQLADILAHLHLLNLVTVA